MCTALLVAGGGTVGWAATQQVGAPPAPPPAASSSEHTKGDGSPTEHASPNEKGDSASSGSAASASPTPTPTPTPMSASRPIEVRLPAIDVESPLQGLGLDSAGRLEVPEGERYDEACWYTGSPTPGETGPSVLLGHVTGSGHDPSVFFDLGATKVGDRIEVDRKDGSTAVFEVTKVRQYAKDDFPRAAVYGSVDDPELRVITCGGTYDESARRHLSNIVVYAELVD